MAHPEGTRRSADLPARWSLDEEGLANQVLCIACQEWVLRDETVVVAGKHDARTHICLKHLKK